MDEQNLMQLVTEESLTPRYPWTYNGNVPTAI